ncbi:MAG: anti-sigma factor antagonist [Mycobacteriales bacterium]
MSDQGTIPPRVGERVGSAADRVAELEAEVAGLRRAMETRGVIEQAKGVLIERHGWDATRAFRQLVTMSQRTNTKLTELAALVVQDAAAHRATSPTDEAWAYRLIDLLVTPAMVLAPIRDERGLLTDFRIQHANPTTTDLVGRTAEQIVGHRLRRLYPGLELSGAFAAFVRVLETGDSYLPAEQAWIERVGDQIRTGKVRMHAAPFLDGVLVTWQPLPAGAAGAPSPLLTEAPPASGDRPPLRISVVPGGPAAVLTASGEIDLTTIGRLEQALDELRHAGHDKIVLDIADVGFCDSAGVSCLVRTYLSVKESGGWLRLAGTQQHVLTVLHISGFTDILPTYPTVAEAVADSVEEAGEVGQDGAGR